MHLLHSSGLPGPTRIQASSSSEIGSSNRFPFEDEYNIFINTIMGLENHGPKLWTSSGGSCLHYMFTLNIRQLLYDYNFFTFDFGSKVKTYLVFKCAIVRSRLKLYPRRDIPKVQKMIGVICLQMVWKGRQLDHLQQYLNHLACRRKTGGWFMIWKNNRHGHWSSLYTVKAQEYTALCWFVSHYLFIFYRAELLTCEC